MDNLEKYIRDNRSAFDTGTPPPDLWSKIQGDLAQADPSKPPADQKTDTRLRFMRPFAFRQILGYAAMGIFLLMAGAFGSYHFFNDGSMATSVAVTPAENPVISMESELKNVFEKRYQQLARYDYDPSIDQDIKQLDEVLNDLRSELQIAPRGTETQLVKAVIANYQTRIEILERVLSRMESNPSPTQLQNNEPNEYSL